MRRRELRRRNSKMTDLAENRDSDGKCFRRRGFGLFASGLADRKQFEKHETARNAELRRTSGKRIMSDHIIHDHNGDGIDDQAAGVVGATSQTPKPHSTSRFAA
jgi:hypothetical protein